VYFVLSITETLQCLVTTKVLMHQTVSTRTTPWLNAFHVWNDCF